MLISYNAKHLDLFDNFVPDKPVRLLEAKIKHVIKFPHLPCHNTVVSYSNRRQFLY
jgi:hypothetical protein